MPSDSSVIVLKKSGQKAEFGSAMYTTMCPQCQRFLKWKQAVSPGDDTLEPGIMKASCCGRDYEMYSETVTIKLISGKPIPKVNAQHRHHSHVTNTRQLV